MEAFLQSLDDAKALHILNNVAQAQPNTQNMPPVSMLTELLTHEFGDQADAPKVSEGELARLALDLFSQDEERRAAIRALATQPSPQRFSDSVTLISMGTLALIALSTQVDFQRDKDGKWSLSVHRDSLKDSTLLALAKALLAYLKNGPK